MWIYNYDKRHQIKKRLPTDVHFMNKNEASMMRKLMSETGMTEIEIRQIKKYRKMLSEAQDKGEISTKSLQERYVNRLMKQVTKELKLAKEHPLVIQKFRELLDKKRNSGYFPWYMR